MLISRRRDRLESLALELRCSGCAVTVLAADLSREIELRAVETRIAGEKALALLVNNAGFGLRGAFWTADLATLDKMHQLHVTAVLRLTHAALGVLIPRRSGAVINVASVAAFATRAGGAAYGASKAWLTSFTEGLYLDLRAAGSAVRVQALCPGFTTTEFHDLLGETRAELAPPWLWLSAERVVDASLRGLRRGALIVVPGWPYALMVAVLSKLPLRMKLIVESAAANRRRLGARLRSK